MFREVTTEVGVIALDRATVGAIIVNEVANLDGKLLLCSPGGRPARIAPGGRGDDGNFFDFTRAGAGVDLRIFVIVRVGAGIAAVTESFATGVKARVEALLDTEVRGVTVAVKGVLSKHIAKRDMEVRFP